MYRHRPTRLERISLNTTPFQFATIAPMSFDVAKADASKLHSVFKELKQEENDAIEQEIARDTVYSQARNTLNQEDGSTLFFDALVNQSLDNIKTDLAYGYFGNVANNIKKGVSNILNDKRFQFLKNAEEGRRNAIDALDKNTTISDRTRNLYKDNYNKDYKNFIENYINVDENGEYHLTPNLSNNVALKNFEPKSQPVPDLDINALIKFASETQKPNIIEREEENYSTNLPYSSDSYNKSDLKSLALVTITKQRTRSEVTKEEIAKTAYNAAKNNPDFPKQAYQLYMGDKNEYDKQRKVYYEDMTEAERNSDDGKALKEYLDKENNKYYCNSVARVNNQKYYEKYTFDKIKDAVDASGYDYKVDRASKSEIVNTSGTKTSEDTVDPLVAGLSVNGVTLTKTNQ